MRTRVHRVIRTSALIPPLVALGCAANPKLHVDDTHSSIQYSGKSGPGEAQSTVVPPGLKSQCPNGRLLVTNDLRRPPASGTIIGRNLDDPNGANVTASFSALPMAASDVTWGTNDHDISTLPNGDVILTFSAHFKMPLAPKPAWFDSTYKGTFGPGARRGVITYRSTDCGQTFDYASTVDPAVFGDGTCAFPRPTKGTTKTNGVYPPPYSNGGVDGNLARTDLVTGKSLYMMFQCTGNLPDPNKPGFQLTANKVGKTWVLRSDDEGSTWNTLGTIGVARWRIGVAPVENGKLAFAWNNQVLFAAPQSGNKYKFDSAGIPTSGVDAGWKPAFDKTVAPWNTIGANIWGSTVIAKSPHSWSVVTAFPDLITDKDGKESKAYRLYLYDRVSNRYAESAPVLPSKHGPNDMVMHLTAIEPGGTGPILLYWYDLDGDAGTATIRGRLVFGNELVSQDFVVAKDTLLPAPQPGPPPKIVTHSFQYAAASGKYWYGDYHSAGAYAAGTDTWHYYPIWIQPDKTVRFAHVTATIRAAAAPGFSTVETAPAPVWKSAAAQLDLAKQEPMEIEVEEEGGPIEAE